MRSIFLYRVREHIHVHSPSSQWNGASDEHEFEHGSMRYLHSMKMEGQEIDLHFELKHFQDHVPVEGLQEYWDMTDEMKI